MVLLGMGEIKLALESRSYTGPEDLQLILALLTTVRPAARIADFPGAVDLHELLASGVVQDNTRLWFTTSDRLAAFALVDQYNNLVFEFDPARTEAVFEAELLAWGVTCARRLHQTLDEAGALDASSRVDDVARIALLTRLGFIQQEGYSLHFQRALAAPLPAPQLPAGFTLRHVTGEEEAETLAALHRAAFGTEFMTLEERLAMMRTPDYDPTLDLVVAAPDGRLAAYCMGLICYEENQHSGRNVGYTDPVATHPNFQRQGLARALLLAGLQKLQERGMDVAMLGTSSDNLPMQRAAQSVGFELESTTLWFSRALDEP